VINSNRIQFFFFCALLFTVQFVVHAQSGSITIDSKVDKGTIRIGDLIVYSVILRHDPEIEVVLPELGANLGNFEIRDYNVHDRRIENEHTVEQIDYTISTFDTGEFEIPSVAFFYNHKDDTLRAVLKTQPIKIVVESLKPSEAGDIRDLKEPHELPRDYRQLLIWGGIILAVLICVGILIYIWYRRRLGKSLLPTKTEPPRPVHEIALDELEALRASPLLLEGKVKEYYIILSEIIRRYIEGRYFIVAMELTSLELDRELRNADIDPQHTALINSFMADCDMVKFAKYLPTDEENINNIQNAFEIVKKTKLVYSTPEETLDEGDGNLTEAENIDTDVMIETVHGHSEKIGENS